MIVRHFILIQENVHTSWMTSVTISEQQQSIWLERVQVIDNRSSDGKTVNIIEQLLTLNSQGCVKYLSLPCRSSLCAIMIHKYTVLGLQLVLGMFQLCEILAYASVCLSDYTMHQLSLEEFTRRTACGAGNKHSCHVFQSHTLFLH